MTAISKPITKRLLTRGHKDSPKGGLRVGQEVSQRTNQKTSRPGPSLSSQRGFTLIELMLVLGIIAALLIATGRRIYKGSETPQSIVRKVSVLSRHLHTQAKIQGTVFRLALSIDDGEDGEEKSAQAVWVERANHSGSILILAQDPDDILDQAKKAKERKEDDDEEPKPEPFAMDTTILKEPITLPSNLQFKQIETDAYTEPVISGRAYVHFFPQGLVEEAVIQLTNEKGLEWSLLVHPLTGKMDLVRQHVELRDLRDN